jgi:hypothetical protein
VTALKFYRKFARLGIYREAGDEPLLRVPAKPGRTNEGRET